MRNSSSISEAKAAYLRSKGWKLTTMTLFGIIMPAYISPYTGKCMLPLAAVKSQNRQDSRAAINQPRKPPKKQ
jgi:hypothetical protein